MIHIIYASEQNPVLINELSDLDAFMDELNPNIEVIWGLYDDSSLKDEVKITIIATGFGLEEDIIPAPHAERNIIESLINKYYPPKKGVTEDEIADSVQEKEFLNENPAPKNTIIKRLGDLLAKLMEDEAI